MQGGNYNSNLQFQVVEGSGPKAPMHSAVILVPIILGCCVTFSILALNLNWYVMEMEFDFDDPSEDDLTYSLEDDLSEREIKAEMAGDRERLTQDNDDLEDEGYEDTVSQKITLKVLTIIVLVFTGICALLSFAAFTNFLPLINISSILLWIILLLVVVEVVFYALFYNPFAGDSEDDDSDSDIECDDDDIEGGGTLNIYGEVTTECTIMGEDATITMQYNASFGFWFMAFQVVLIFMAAIFNMSHARSLNRNNPTTQIHMF